MNVSADIYLERLRAASSTGNNARFTEFRRQIYQSFSDNHDWLGIEDFFRGVVLACVPKEVQSALFRKTDELPTLSEALGNSLQTAVGLAADDPGVAALYCEYFDDGGDASSLDVYLCLRFDREDDFWASDFNRSVSGPRVDSYFDFDPKGELLDPTASVAREYLHARLLGVVGRLADEHVRERLPFGFAEHDGFIVYVQSRVARRNARS